MTDHLNTCSLIGIVSSEPRARISCLGAVVQTFTVRTELTDGATDVPVVLVADVLDVEPGDTVRIDGRIERRYFRAGGATQSRVEVIATFATIVDRCDPHGIPRPLRPEPMNADR